MFADKFYRSQINRHFDIALNAVKWLHFDPQSIVELEQCQIVARLGWPAMALRIDQARRGRLMASDQTEYEWVYINPSTARRADAPTHIDRGGIRRCAFVTPRKIGDRFQYLSARD
jgi:hypothetical protein